MVTQDGQGGTERNKKVRDRSTRTEKQREKHGYAYYYFLSLFLYFHLFFVLLFFFPDYFFSDNYNNRRGAKGKRLADGMGYVWAATAMWDSTYVFFYVFVLSTLLFYSYHSSSFSITFFSVEYNNGRAGRDQWQRGTGRGSRQA